MAGKIIRRWKLAVLRVGLDLSGRQPEVRSRLDGFATGSDVTYWQRNDPLNMFGLSISADVPERVVIPDSLVEAVRETMRHELSSESALWLRLEPPYGYLAAAPWEDLAKDIDVPVLRVPDRLPVAVQLGWTWRIAMVVNAPNGAKWGASHVRQFTSAMGDVMNDRPVEVEVFTDVHTYELLRHGTDNPYVAIRVHDPHGARAAYEQRSSDSRVKLRGRPTSGLRAFEPYNDPRLLWADWITSGLKGVAVSAIHVASSGSVKAGRPVLALTSDPARALAPSKGTTVDTDDLRTIADVLGASTVSIAAPESRGTDVGARVLADRLGQQRPGPTIFSSLKRDPDSRELAEVHAFLAAPHDRDLPSSSSWFGYIQPESLKEALLEPLLPHHTGQEMPSTSRAGHDVETETSNLHLSIEDKFSGAQEVPVWVASSSRFLEAKNADLAALRTTPGAGKESVRAYDVGVSEALSDIEAMVQRHIGGF
jgi:hypothetical protein